MATATRAAWKGFLKISLVSIPVKVFAATEAGATLSFNQIHQACQTRIQQKKWCPRCERSVPSTELVKGYEFEKDRFVLLEEQDFDQVRPASTRVIDLVQFADAGALDPLSIDRAYYLAPDGGLTLDAFAVMREGLRGKVGVGKLALYGREYLVAVLPRGRGLVLYTLHRDAEVRAIDDIEDLNAVPLTADPVQVKLARQVVAAFDAPIDLADYRDAYREGLQAIIDAKIAGREIVTHAADTAAPPMGNFTEALQRSLQTVAAKRKRNRPRHVAAPARKRKRA
jgi:DNA end-binding protein Ku